MKRKTLISVAVMIIMLLNCIAPIFSVYAVESNTQSITLNSELYTAVSTYMKSNYTGFAYNDLLRTITASGSNFSSVENLSLKEAEIDDISGLEVFTGLKTLDLSGNYLDLDSNLEIINGLSSLENLDLSTNKIDGFSWLTLEGLEYSNFQRQSVENVKIISVKNQYKDEFDSEGNKIPNDVPSEIVETTEGLISEFDLESRDLEVNTYTTQGKIWNNDGKTAGVQEGRTTVGTDTIDYEENRITLKKMYSLKNSNKMYNITAKVINSKNKYYDSIIDLSYIIVDEDEEGIIFKDENFYKAVKLELKYGMLEGTDSNVIAKIQELIGGAEGAIFKDLFSKEAEDKRINLLLKNAKSAESKTSEKAGTNFTMKVRYLENNTWEWIVYDKKAKDYKLDNKRYSSAYDKALTLVIKKEDLFNKIPTLIVDNEKVSDLTGLEKFSGLKQNFSATYNYIDSIEKIIELEENKAKMEEELRQKISEQITNISTAKSGLNSEESVSYLGIIKDYLDNNEEIQKQIDELGAKTDKTEEEENKIVELNEQLDNMRELAVKSMEKIEKIFKKIYKIKNESENMATIQTSTLYKIEDVENIKDKETAKTCLKEQLEKLKMLEENKYLDSEIAKEITGAFPNTFIKTDPVDTSLKLGPIGVLLKFNNDEDIDALSLGEIKTILGKVKTQDNNNNILTNDYTDLEKCYEVAGRLTQNNTQEMLSIIIVLPRLKNLNLEVNNIESIEGIDKLTKLENLNVKDNLITTIDNVDWTKVEKLKVLNLAKNQISNIDKLNELSPHLNTLNVSDCLLSGKFEFDFVKMGIKNVDFSGNYYTDLSYLMDKYYGKVKKSDSDSLAEYLKGKGYKYSFARQTINIDFGNANAKDNEPLTFGLPSIFADIEEIDPYHTTFGVVPGDGSVEEHGNSVTFSKYNSGINTGYIDIETVKKGVNNSDGSPSIGEGTRCYIKYTVGNSSSEITDPVPTNPNTPTDPINPTEPVDPKPTTPTDPSTGSSINGSKEATSENVAIDEYSEDKANFMYIYEPDVTVASLAKLFEFESTEKSTGNRTSSSVVNVNGNTDVANDKSRAFTTETITINFKSYDLETSELEVDEDRTYEIVVLGDIDGDGDIDSIDSGYARALKYDTLYNDISSKAERTALMNAFKQTANYKAVDMNLDEKITTDETASILYYRAGLLDSFKTFNK